MRLISKRFRWIGVAWRLLSEADTFISVLGWASITVSGVLATLISTWAYFQGAPWPALIVLFILALAALVFITFQTVKFVDWRRNKQKEELRERYLNPVSVRDKELLDFLVDGVKAAKDINRVLTKAANETARMGRKIKFYTWQVRTTRNINRKRKIISNAAQMMTLYAGRLKEHAHFIGRVNPILENNYKSYIEKCEIKSDEEANSVNVFIKTIETTSKAVPPTIEALKSYRDSARSLAGVSSDLNAASNRMVSVIGTFIGKIRSFGRVCERVQAVAEQKLIKARGLNVAR